MSCPLDPRLAENLHRWQQSGEPARWLEARAGQWEHADWLALLESLRRSPYWPLDLGAVGRALEEAARRWRNLARWKATGAPRRWVEECQGRWDHGQWLALLERLRRSEFWPLDRVAVGAVLEECRASREALRRWEQSGEPYRWVEVHEGRWERRDWLALVVQLRHSDFGPLDPEDVRAVLEEAALRWRNLRRWQEDGAARAWVNARQGEWTHADWLALLDSLWESDYWPIEPEALGRVLDGLKGYWRNLHRWEEAGGPRRWAELRQGVWEPADWLALLRELRHSDYWPLDPDAVAEALQRAKVRWENLRRWQESGQGWDWVVAHGGEWDEQDWLALSAQLCRSDCWPLDLEAVAHALVRFKVRWWRLRWQEASGQPPPAANVRPRAAVPQGKRPAIRGAA